MFKVEYFTVDQNLMYLLQSLTKENTAVILDYFHSLGLQIAEDFSSRKPKKRINKTLQWHYKNSVVPYKLEVYTYYNQDLEDSIIPLAIKVKFPASRTDIDVTKMIESIVETGLELDGSTQLPNFSSPYTRVPAGFKKLLHE